MTATRLGEQQFQLQLRIGDLLQSCFVFSHASPQLQEWREALDIDVVGGKMDWCVSPGVIWRGALHFVEHKVCHDFAVVNCAT